MSISIQKSNQLQSTAVLLVAVSLLSSYLVQLIEKPVAKILFPSKPQPLTQP